MSRSADKVEREVEQSRERLDRTLDELQSRLDVSGLKHRLTDVDWRSASPNGIARNLLSTVREYPVPVLMICTGLCWLLYETLDRNTRSRRPPFQGRVDAPAMAAEEPGRPVHDAGAARMEAGLDEALEETFPGSDPVAVQITR